MSTPAPMLFDLESAADLEACDRLMPVFDPNEVKCGNLKDAVKIAEKIEEARSSHESNWREKAALRPETGTILAIGFYHPDLGISINTVKNMNGEKDLIQDFWERSAKYHKDTGEPMAGWWSSGFDLPYIIIRSRILGIRVPSDIRKGRYFNSSKFIDLMDDWLLGRQRTEVKCSLDHVAKSLGVEGKSGSGRDFGEKFSRNYEEAVNYLYQDMVVTKEVARKLGYQFEPTTVSWADWKAKYLDKKPESPESPEF